MSISQQLSVGLSLAAVLLVGACGPSEEEVKSAARAEEWAALEASHRALVEKREQLAELRTKLAAGAEALGELPEGESPEDALAALQAQVQEMTASVNTDADSFAERLVSFINEYAGFEGEEPFPEVKKAIGLKSLEDIELARDYVVRGGDWGKAVEILESALVVDPDNQSVMEELERAKKMRYMDEERWALVKKGMTEAEVVAALGQVKHQNVRKYDDRGVTAWFYPRAEGAAAAVFFREQGGQLKVYQMDFEAVKTAAERAE